MITKGQWRKFVRDVHAIRKTSAVYIAGQKVSHVDLANNKIVMYGADNQQVVYKHPDSVRDEQTLDFLYMKVKVETNLRNINEYAYTTRKV